MPPSPTIVWFRRDLRLRDNGALAEASRLGAPVLPLYIHGESGDGAASEWWLHHSLKSLSRELGKRGLRLLIRTGRPKEVLAALAGETGAGTILWNRLYEPATSSRDTAIMESLRNAGIDARSFAGHLLFEPQRITTRQGEPFKVFTPFWRHLCLLNDPLEPLAIPSLKHPELWPESETLESLNLPPRVDWAAGFRDEWKPGEASAHERLEHFLSDAIARYGEDRDRPGVAGSSRLSPHLHFGEITPRTIWHMVNRNILRSPHIRVSAQSYLRELGWREFCAHLLHHFPATAERPLRKEFDHFPWLEDAAGLRAWQRGLTGFPIVDAGMRELWHTGWMHNRVRMIVASFLVKDLLIPWQRGAEWFWDTLVDADLASNAMGWQWTAGCGADAPPFFRVFNPTLQAAKFDPQGTYIRRWIPEISTLPGKHLFTPWEAPAHILHDAGVILGESYPAPIVDHGEARDRALAAFQKIKKN